MVTRKKKKEQALRSLAREMKVAGVKYGLIQKTAKCKMACYEDDPVIDAHGNPHKGLRRIVLHLEHDSGDDPVIDAHENPHKA